MRRSTVESDKLDRKVGLAKVLVASLLAIAPAAAARGADLLYNGNFNLDDDANGQPDGWFSWTFGDTAFAAYKTADPADVYSEDGSAYVNAGNYGDWWTSGGGWFQIVGGGEGSAYSLTCDSATENWDNAAGEMRIIFLDASNTELARNVYHTADYVSSLPWSTYLMTAVAPAGTTQVKAEIATWGARGSVLWDNIQLVDASVWNVDASGSWFAGGNWVGGSPNGVDAAARFLGAISSNQTVAIDSPITLGSLGFDNSNGYVLAGAGSLTLQTSNGLALVDVKQGIQKINLPLMIASDTKLNVLSGATLQIADPVTVAAGKSLYQSGPGTVAYQSSVTLQNAASITFANATKMTTLTLASAANAKVAVHGSGADNVLSVTSLSIASDAKLDMTDNSMIVDYTGSTPIANVRTMLHNGQIVSTSTPAAHALGYIESSKLLGASGGTFSGQSVDGTAILMKLTFTGDTLLDGVVNIVDLGNLAGNWQSTSGDWSKGDFNFDGLVNIVDLGMLAANWQQGASGAAASASLSDALASLGLPNVSGAAVPEPASMSAILFAASSALLTGRRASRSRRCR